MTRFCLKCGTPLAAGAARCSHCQTPVPQNTPPPRTTTPAFDPQAILDPYVSPAQEAENTRGGCLFGSILVTLVLGAIIFWCITSVIRIKDDIRNNVHSQPMRYVQLPLNQPSPDRYYRVTDAALNLSLTFVEQDKSSKEVHSIIAPLVNRDAPGSPPYHLLMRTENKEIRLIAERVINWHEGAPTPKGVILADDGSYLYPLQAEGNIRAQGDDAYNDDFKKMEREAKGEVAADWVLFDERKPPTQADATVATVFGVILTGLLLWCWTAYFKTAAHAARLKRE